MLTVSRLVLGTRAAAGCLLDSDWMQAVERLGANFSRTNALVVRAAVIGEDAGGSTGRGGAFVVIEALCGAHLSALRRDSRRSVSTVQE